VGNRQIVGNFSSLQAVEWESNPPRLGFAVAVANPFGTNWMVERRLAMIAAAPEFTFPLQLFYHSERTQRGEFGDQWFCPQLESTVLPKEKGLLEWKTPQGTSIGLILDESRANYFADPGNHFVAKVAGPLTTITSDDGWIYKYSNARLELVQAPTGRQSDFVYGGSTRSQVIAKGKYDLEWHSPHGTIVEFLPDDTNPQSSLLVDIEKKILS